MPPARPSGSPAPEADLLYTQLAAKRREVLAALQVGITGEEPDLTQKRPFTFRYKDGTKVVFN